MVFDDYIVLFFYYRKIESEVIEVSRLTEIFTQNIVSQVRIDLF